MEITKADADKLNIAEKPVVMHYENETLAELAYLVELVEVDGSLPNLDHLIENSFETSHGKVLLELMHKMKKLQELVKAKDEYIACYKTGHRPTEKLMRKLEVLKEDLNL